MAEAFTDFIPHAKQFDSSKDEGHGSSDGVEAAKIQIGLHSKMQGGTASGASIELIVNGCVHAVRVPPLASSSM